MKDTIETVEQRSAILAEGKTEMPLRPTIRLADPPGLINVMPAKTVFTAPRGFSPSMPRR